VNCHVCAAPDARWHFTRDRPYSRRAEFCAECSPPATKEGLAMVEAWLELWAASSEEVYAFVPPIRRGSVRCLLYRAFRQGWSRGEVIDG